MRGLVFSRFFVKSINFIYQPSPSTLLISISTPLMLHQLFNECHPSPLLCEYWLVLTINYDETIWFIVLLLPSWWKYACLPSTYYLPGSGYFVLIIVLGCFSALLFCSLCPCSTAIFGPWNNGQITAGNGVQAGLHLRPGLIEAL